MKWLLLLLSSFPFFLQAQVTYTFLEDHQFLHEKDLEGYTFVPNEGKLSSAHYPDPVKEGLVQFKVTSTGVEIIERVTFSTSGIKGENNSKPLKMSVARIDKKHYGYEVVLMDIKNPNVQGYIQFYVARGYVHTIKYKPEPSASERTYSLKVLPEYQNERDSKYFSHDNDYEIKNLKNLYDQRLYPFAELTDQYDYREFRRLFPKDLISFKFETRFIQKKRKEVEVYYLIINNPANQEMPKLELLIKKSKDIRWKDRVQRKEREAIQLNLFDETNKQNYEVILFRNAVSKKLKSIRFQNKEYLLRQNILRESYEELKKQKEKEEEEKRKKRNR